ncbi:peptidase domain-containing ABC transporter [Massilia sp. BSC265]|uniref:peptidase domain-containing ABC transporter n=1 Tax=Massilia sp. BSC265 TaxID=1549812 RepID=UPI000AE04AE3
MILQTEAAECGPACLAMLAAYHGRRIDLPTLRRRHSVSLRAATLGDLMEFAAEMHLGTRPLRLDLHELRQLKLPCILHWDFNHFVVLKSVGAHSVVIHDPALGVREISLKTVSERFTGIALELWPKPQFQPRRERRRVSIRDLVGTVHGLRRSLAQILLLAAALEVFALTSPLFLQWVMDEAVVAADLDLLTTLALGFGLLMLLQQVISSARSWAIVYLGTVVNVQWRESVFAHLLRLPVQYFEKRHLGDVVSRFGAIDRIEQTLTTSFLEGVVDGLMAIATLGMMYLYSPLLSGICVVAMALSFLLRKACNRPIMTSAEEAIVHAAKQESHFLETIRGIKTVKLFQRQEQRRLAWMALMADQINAELRGQRLQLAYKLASGVLLGIEHILVIWLGARLAIDGTITLGMLVAFNAYRLQFDARVGAFIDKLFAFRMLGLQAERLADIVLSEPEAGPAPSPRRSPVAPPLAATIEARGLAFRFSEREPHVLENVDLRIEAGEAVAIVGSSGCGKTTLISLLSGLLAPTAGEVLIGGRDIATLGIDAVRQMTGTVLQDDVLFAGSIADNISFFDPQPDFGWIAECARMASIADEIDQMPMGYDTLVGDMGTAFSGGQKQRLLLARALYKRPQILFLDEATSHLDVAREHQVTAAVAALPVTRVIVAHRPETIAGADRVLTLSGGRVLVPESPWARRRNGGGWPAGSPTSPAARPPRARPDGAIRRA